MNARDAMPDGGTLTLATDRVEDTTEPDQVRLIVSDTGHGMTEEVRDRVFQPFFTTKTMGKGTGLGLATVYGFVSQSGGAIDVAGTPGEGATFTLLFPRSPEELSEREAEAPVQEGTPATGHVLVVEDDPNVQRVVRKTLERTGFTVDAVDNGEDALAAIEAEPGRVDVILTDLILPGVSGRRIVDRVLEGYRTIPVVVMSGYAEDQVGGDTLPSDVEFIQKPFTTGAIVAKVREAVARRG